MSLILYLILTIQRKFIFWSVLAIKNPEDKQMKVTYELLSNKDVDEIAREAVMRVGDQPSKKKKKEYDKWNSEYLTHYMELSFAKKVKKIENIFFKIDGKVQEIKEVVTLYNMKNKVASTIVMEIKEVLNKHEETHEKNLESPSISG